MPRQLRLTLPDRSRGGPIIAALASPDSLLAPGPASPLGKTVFCRILLGGEGSQDGREARGPTMRDTCTTTDGGQGCNTPPSSDPALLGGDPTLGSIPTAFISSPASSFRVTLLV